jgi:Cu2+-exporting ATPase
MVYVAAQDAPRVAKVVNLPDTHERRFAIEGIVCAACVQTIEDRVSKIAGVLEARVNYSSRRLFVRWQGGLGVTAAIADELGRLGYRAHPLRKVADDDEKKYEQWILRCLAVAGFAAMNVMLLSVSVWSGNATDITTETRDFFHWLSALIVLPAVAYAGQPFFRSAFEAISARRVNMDVPISLGVMLALSLSVYETATHGVHAYFDSAIMLLFFLLVGRCLEQTTRQRMRSAAHNISSLQMSTATRIEGGRPEVAEVEDLRPGDTILVRAGDRFPVDSVITEGDGTIDQSIVNGETAGARVGRGSRVFAGSIAIDGQFHASVQSLARDSFVESLERLIETAISARLPYMQVANRAARLYAPVVHGAALLTLLGWLLIGAGLHDSVVTAIAVLIITCPCALALAVPTVQVVSMSEMFRQRILVNSPDLTERLAEVDMVVFDKTGTLTLPEAVVCNADKIEPDLVTMGARIAAGSKHPLARAVAILRGNPVPFSGIVEERGRGVRAMVDGLELRLGSAEFCSALGRYTSTNDEASSSIFLRFGERAAEFSVKQYIRADAAGVVRKLEDAGYVVKMISGDKRGPVESVARKCGISDWEADCTPEGKLRILDELRETGRKILMVGDGLNDAPALAAAHVSLSPITAADLTQAQADGLFLGDEMRPVIDAIMISRRAKTMMVQNLALAVIYNLIAIPLAVFGFVTPLVAAAAMSGSSILVSVNSLRTRRWNRKAEQTSSPVGAPRLA